MKNFWPIILIILYLTISSLSFAKNDKPNNEEDIYELVCSEDISFDSDAKKIISDSEIFIIFYNRESGELTWSSSSENKKIKIYQYEGSSNNGSKFHFQRTIRFKKQVASSDGNETLYLTSVLSEESPLFFSEIITVRGLLNKDRPIPWSLSDARWRCMSPDTIKYLKK